MANTFTFANQTLTDADIFGGINFLHDLNTGDEFTIGNTASASVKFVTGTQLPLYSKDATNGTFTWTQNSISRGRYYITDVTKTNGKYEVTAYDAMILLDANVSALSLSLPTTVSGIASAIATYIGCTVSGTVTNGSLAVTSSMISSDLNCRQLLHYVAEASGCSVKIDGSDHLCFMYYASSGITVSASAYMEGGLNVADYTCAKIDNVTIYNTEGNLQGQAGSGSNALYIGGNPLLDGASNTNATNILNVVKNLQYAPFRCEMFNENGLEIGTTATFGSTTTLVMHIESSESGAMASAVGSDNRAAYNKDILTVVNETNAIAVNAQTIAGQASQILSDMQTAATAAGTTLNGIYATAEAASNTLAGMQAAATAAGTTLNGIYETAEAASEVLVEMENAATDAGTTLLGIYQQAAAAQEAANGAQYSLSEIEQVVDVLNWISAHGSYVLTTDTEVQPGKWYFELINGEYVNVTPPDGSDPSALGLYVLDNVDSSISNYVSSHVSLDANGLVIQTDGVQSKVRISGSGVQLTNEQGNAIATFSSTITLGQASGMHVTLSPGDSTQTPPVLPELGFWQGSTKVAYINSETLHITKAEIESQLRIGQFLWKVQSANRVSLVYSPTN